jgi:hypothetical protein
MYYVCREYVVVQKEHKDENEKETRCKRGKLTAVVVKCKDRPTLTYIDIV